MHLWRNDDMQPLVTVAVAAYNVEKFLENGMSSIFNQTYKNIEIILVDDGSTDRTSKICDEIAKRDRRVKVFHKTNGGLGSARNVGIDNAKGEFIYFFDVDDSIETNLIEENVKIAQKRNVDLVIFGYYARYSNEDIEELITLPEIEIHSNEELKKAYVQYLLWLKHGNGFAWNKFYRLSFIKKNNFHFGNQRVQQDEPFNMQLYLKLNHVYICSKAYYHYVLYVNANAGSRYLLNKEEIIKDVYHKFMEFYNTWKLNDKRVLKYIENRFISGIFGVVTLNYYHLDCHLSNEEREEKIKNIIMDEDVSRVLKNVKISYSKNPINTIQAWAFNTRRVKLLMFMTNLKINLKKMMKGRR